MQSILGYLNLDNPNPPLSEQSNTGPYFIFTYTFSMYFTFPIIILFSNFKERRVLVSKNVL